MNDSPACPRCSGVLHFHVEPVVDHVLDTGYTWKPRPVGLAGNKPVGVFATYSCHACNYTSWYARGWPVLVAQKQLAKCLHCRTTTEHAKLPAIENIGNGYAPVPIIGSPTTLTNAGGFLLEICVPCGHVTWRAFDYQQRNTTRARGAPCLLCGEEDATMIPSAVEAESERVAIFVKKKKAVGWYSLRVCEGCASVEWQAHGLDGPTLAHAPEDDGQVHTWATPPEGGGDPRGPYR